MNAQLKSLYDKKGKIVNEMKDAFRLVSERGGVATADEKRQFNAWDAELEEVNSNIELHERMAKADLVLAASEAVKLDSATKTEKKYNDKATAVERRNALSKANKVGYAGLTEEERTIVDTEHRDMAVFEKVLRGRELNAEELKVVDRFREKRALSKGTTTAGGYTVPEGFAGRIVEYMKFISNLLNFASIIRTDTGVTIPFPINDDTSNTGELIGENSDLSSSSADLVFSVYNLGAYKFSSKMIKVSSELIQDNGVNLIDYLAKKLAERVARITNTYFTTGTGSSQPQGYLAAATRGKVTASTSTFTSAEMIALQDSVDIAYQANASWSFHQNILSEIKQLTIGTNYNSQLWVPSFRDGEPDLILGKPYFINQAMTSTSATGDKIMTYGDHSKFNIRIVNDFTLRSLSERYAEYDQTAWFGLMRADSFLEDNTAVKYMDIS